MESGGCAGAAVAAAEPALGQAVGAEAGKAQPGGRPAAVAGRDAAVMGLLDCWCGLVASCVESLLQSVPRNVWAPQWGGAPSGPHMREGYHTGGCSATSRQHAAVPGGTPGAGSRVPSAGVRASSCATLRGTWTARRAPWKVCRQRARAAVRRVWDELRGHQVLLTSQHYLASPHCLSSPHYLMSWPAHGPTAGWPRGCSSRRSRPPPGRD